MSERERERAGERGRVRVRERERESKRVRGAARRRWYPRSSWHDGTTRKVGGRLDEAAAGRSRGAPPRARNPPACSGSNPPAQPLAADQSLPSASSSPAEICPTTPLGDLSPPKESAVPSRTCGLRGKGAVTWADHVGGSLCTVRQLPPRLATTPCPRVPPLCLQAPLLRLLPTGFQRGPLP